MNKEKIRVRLEPSSHTTSMTSSTSAVSGSDRRWLTVALVLVIALFVASPAFPEPVEDGSLLITLCCPSSW